VFLAGVQPLRVLTDDDEIDAIVGNFDAGKSADGADAGEEVEFLAETDVDGAEAFADRSGAGAFQSNAMLADEIERGLGQWIAEVFGGAEASPRFHPGDNGTGGMQYGLHCRRHLWTDAVPRDQYDRCTHAAPPAGRFYSTSVTVGARFVKRG
jgi:hypothetical protein